MSTLGRGTAGRGPNPAHVTSVMAQVPGGISQWSAGGSSESSNSSILRPSTLLIAVTRAGQSLKTLSCGIPCGRNTKTFIAALRPYNHDGRATDRTVRSVAHGGGQARLTERNVLTGGLPEVPGRRESIFGARISGVPQHVCRFGHQRNDDI